MICSGPDLREAEEEAEDSGRLDGGVQLAGDDVPDGGTRTRPPVIPPTPAAASAVAAVCTPSPDTTHACASLAARQLEQPTR